ncbi:MAG: type III-B CRISPR module-associated protein Cmr5 [Chlorobiaceae bacterium]|nr:type III-B CRISPR module-associated protein Cmr5 [Chlorobiaceae bacterium]
MNQRLQTERNRAETAYRYADEGVNKYGKKTSGQQADNGEGSDVNYKSIVDKLPARILNNGLGVAVAFHFSKSKNKKGEETVYGYVCNQLRQWLFDQGHVQGSATISKFAREVVTLSPADSRAATNEALAFLTWLRRFTDGLSSQSNDNSSSDGSTGES